MPIVLRFIFQGLPGVIGDNKVEYVPVSFLFRIIFNLSRLFVIIGIVLITTNPSSR